MMFNRHGKAIDWSSDEEGGAGGPGASTDNDTSLTKHEFVDTLERLTQIETMLVEMPEDEQLQSERILICSKISQASEEFYNASPLQRLKDAVDRFQRAEAASRLYPDDAGLNQELKMAEHAIFRAQWAVDDDDETAVLVEEGNHITDLGDNRVLVVRPFIPLKLKKDQRAAAKKWMAETGRGTNTKNIHAALSDALCEGIPADASFFGVWGSQILVLHGPSLLAAEKRAELD